MVARWVVNGFRSASGSSLIDDDWKSVTKWLIKATHHCKSIFHLLNSLKAFFEHFCVNRLENSELFAIFAANLLEPQYYVTDFVY